MKLTVTAEADPGFGRCHERERMATSTRTSRRALVAVAAEVAAGRGHRGRSGGLRGEWDAECRQQGQNSDELLHDTSPLSVACTSKKRRISRRAADDPKMEKLAFLRQ